MIEPPQWSTAELREDAAAAEEIFRRERLEEPLEDYLEAFEVYQGALEDLLERTVDLSELDDAALDVLTDPDLLQAFRYLAGPPISTDDLKTLAEASSLSPARLRADPDLVRRAIQVVLIGLDRKRFPWVLEARDPTPAERHAAVLASAALMATQRVGTQRRNLGKSAQEQRVSEALIDAGFARVPPRTVHTAVDAPAAGEFCGESVLGTRKADFVIRLWDHRMMPVECKVSNSAINSVKRMNNDAAAKAEAWRADFGRTQVVPTAVLSGVYHLRHLEDAQRRGLTLFWAHDLQRMLAWIDNTRPR